MARRKNTPARIVDDPVLFSDGQERPGKRHMQTKAIDERRIARRGGHDGEPSLVKNRYGPWERLVVTLTHEP